MPFHSQFQEDSWIVKNLKLPEKGIFCEVGALDGIQSSNTLFFEEELKWSGICIEPQYDEALMCRKHRRAVTIAAACRNNSWSEPFRLWGFRYNHDDIGQSKLSTLERDDVVVATFRLDALCQMLCYPNLDLLSIDTEGSELDVWEGCGAMKPAIVIIEYLSGDGVDRSKRIVERFSGDGYKQIHRTEANLIFLKE